MTSESFEDILPEDSHCIGEGDWTCAECGVETGGHTLPGVGRRMLCKRCAMAESDDYVQTGVSIDCPGCGATTDYIGKESGLHACPRCLEFFTVEDGDARTFQDVFVELIENNPNASLADALDDFTRGDEEVDDDE
ncbi:hypothetical protein [Haladaptatus sp. NG-SE-30]